jgi:hypothetical protein
MVRLTFFSLFKLVFSGRLLPRTFRLARRIQGKFPQNFVPFWYSHSQHLFIQAIEALCSFLTSEQPSPAPVGSISKVLRRALFRDVACPSSFDCGRIKALIQQMLALFEENQNEVNDSSTLRDCVVCQIVILLLFRFSH